MQKYSNVVQDRQGRAIAGAKVTVNVLGGGLASLYSDNGVTVIDNPLTTNSVGHFEFYAADGRYSLSISVANVVTATETDILLEDPADGSAALAAPSGSSKVGFQQSGTGAVARTVQDELRDRLSVRGFITTTVDGTTSNQSGIANAVAEAMARGAELFWPAGTYVSDANIPNFHSVRHAGPGVIKRGASLFYVQIRDGQTNTIFVANDGSTANDGLSVSQPTKLANAFTALKNYGPVLSGTWRVLHAAGTYSASDFAQINDLTSTNYLQVIGPDVAFGVPTVIYDMNGSTSSYAMWFGGRMQIKLADIKFINCTTGGALAAAVVLDNGPKAWVRNVHIDNCPGYAFNANINTRILVEGGIYNACQYGIKVYNSVATIGYNAQRVRMSNCITGILIQKSYSHTDYVDYDNCAYGIQSQLGAHTTNYYCTFNNVARPWEAGATSTISTENATYTGTSPTTGRSRTGPFAEDTETTYRFENQFHTVGVNGRSCYGYTDWVVPVVKFQYSKDGGATGFNLSNFAACTAVWESATSTYLGLAAASAFNTGIWFGDETHAQRGEIKQNNGSLLFAFSNSNAFRMRSTDLAPFTDNAKTNGTASLRWSVVYAGTGTINTSDENEKEQVQDIEAAVLRAVRNVDFKQFKFKDAVAAKGDGARWHFGVIAQQIKQAFEAEGIDPFAYGVLCYDEWPEQPEILADEENGIAYEPYRPAGNRYGVRYDELLCLKLAAMESA